MPHTPICPKCGYDQSGEIATWTTQCPLQGTCPECGYELSWPDVVNPSRIRLPWYVEHAESKRQLLRRTIPTLWILLIPNRYWCRVTMETPRSLKRYFLWIAILMAILHILTSAAFVVTSFVLTTMRNSDTEAWMVNQTPEIQAQFQAYLVDTTTFDYWWPLIAESVLYPIVNNSFYYNGLSAIALASAAFFIGISVMWCILFVAFPTTRKRSKLRFVHIARAMIICASLPLFLIELARGFDVLLYIGDVWVPLSRLESQSLLIWNVAVTCLLIWVQWFWISATRIGWKVKARWWELILVMLASFFGVVLGGGIIAIAAVFEPVVSVALRWIGL